MRVAYGVNGQGNGHATRASVVVAHLLARGHDVRAVVSRAARTVLATQLPASALIEGGGYVLATRGDAIDLARTLMRNVELLPAVLAQHASACAALDRFAPDVVLTDYEPLVAMYAKARGLPAFSIDNHHAYARCLRATDILGAANLARLFALMTPGCDHYVVASFFPMLPRPEYRATTTVVPPVLRPAVLAARPSDAGHVLVYQTATDGGTSLLDALATARGQRFVVYGLDRDGTAGNVTARRFDAVRFVRDLATARAVVANAGATLLGEALALGKPVLAVPLRGQLEQELNAAHVERLGYGAHAARLDNVALADFLERRDEFAANLADAGPRHDSNRRLLATVDALLDRVAAGRGRMPA